MNSSATVAGLVPATFLTRTSTVTVPAGAVTVSEVGELTTTLVPAAAPNVAVVPLPKLVPVTVTRVPPDDGPETGDTEVTVGAPGCGGVVLHPTNTGVDIACGLVPPSKPMARIDCPGTR